MNYYLLLLSLFIFIIIFYSSYKLYLFIKTDIRYYLCQKICSFPRHYRQILQNYFTFYQKLPQNLKKRLEACILVFIKTKEFIGRGIAIDDEKKVLIAANACLLTIGQNRCNFKHVTSIFLYPEAVFKEEKIQQGWIVTKKGEVLLGEAWQGGEVILSWKDIVAGDENPKDGKNVALHEFAHQLDMADGMADGTPPLPLKLYKEWSQIMQKAYKDLDRLYKKHKKGFLDPYALTNPAEFFAVATEVFFEQPQKLKKYEPMLYEELKKFYRLDPISWS